MEHPDEMFSNILDNTAESLAESDRESYKSNLEPFESYKERKKMEIKEKSKAFFDKCTRAWEIILADLVGIGNTHPTGEAKKVIEELKEGIEKFATLTKEPGWQLSITEPGHTLKEVLGYSDSLMEQFYQVGFRSFKGAHYEDAEKVFTLISLLNPYEHNAWISLGITQETISKWEEAIAAFKIAEQIRGVDPISLLYQGQCYHAINDRAKALSSYELAIKESGNQPKFAQVKERAMMLKRQMEKA